MILALKPLFLPVDVQHNQCSCRFFNPREIQALWSQNYATEILHIDAWCAVSRVDSAALCHVIIALDITGTTQTHSVRACPNRIENRNVFVFESISDEVSKQNRNVKTEIQAKKATESTTYRPITTCTHADNLALGNTDPPQKQANATKIRSREVVGPLMEVVVRPTLTPRDQVLNYTEKELSTSISQT